MPDLRSPYRTAPGSEPPELAGREGELGAARYALDMAASNEAPNPIVLFGLRGMGKTALLREIARDAAAAGAVTLVIEADRDLRLGNVMRDELRSALASTAAFPAKLRKAMERIAEHLPKVTYELPHDAGSVSVSGGGEGDERHDGLESEILHLNEQLHDGGRFLMIGLDEIQEAARVDLLRIVRVVHRTAGTDAPIFFVGAGLPSIPAILHDVRTYTERWAKYRLDVLTREATFEAIERPAEILGVTWTPEALERMYEVTFGYPYFIQQFASATWLRAAGTTIGRDDVETIVPGVRRLLDASLYEQSFAQLTPREAAFALALHSLGPGRHRLDDVARSLERKSSAEIGSTRARLTRKDIIFSANRGIVEFRMPLANDYIERHRKSIESLAELASNKE